MNAIDAISTLIAEDSRGLPPLQNLFGNRNAVEVEIGCGKGKFLLARAESHPGINFVGVDVIWKWMKYGVTRAEKRAVHNIRFLRCDVRDLLRYNIPDETASVFHIYFPDPWPKRKHRKRRLVTGEFLRTLHSKLPVGGLVELATDHEDYYWQIKRAVVQSGRDWHVRESQNERIFDAESHTNYEIKYAHAGRDLHYIELRK